MRQALQAVYLMFIVAAGAMLIACLAALAASQPSMAASAFHSSFWLAVIALVLIGVDVVVF